MPAAKHLARSALCAVLVGAPGFPMHAQSPAAVPPNFDFRGRFLVVASDTDMLPSAYIDGKLGPVAGPNQLSVLRLDRLPATMPPATVAVSNSVVGPPSAVALTPDGRFAIVNAMLLGTDSAAPFPASPSPGAPPPTARRVTSSFRGWMPG